jgi:prepilin-type N-terminal cleavage/methylation domain-containing protein/prepilin-type processing-associated H-X9-DG protein
MYSSDKRSSRVVSSRSAFTLIELLTVIAIIGILAAILIPTVGKVRNTAQSSRCVSNLRQIGQQIIAYAGDNRGRLPNLRALTWSGVTDPRILEVPAAPNTSTQLAYHLWPYYSKTPITRMPANSRNVSVHEMFICAAQENSVRAKIQGNAYPSDAGVGGRPNFALSYIINDRQKYSVGGTTYTVFGYTGGQSFNLETIEKKLTVVDQSMSLSKIWSVQDADRELRGDSGAVRTTQTDFPEKPSHGGSRNRAYLDGSVKKLTLAESVDS